MAVAILAFLHCLTAHAQVIDIDVRARTTLSVDASTDGRVLQVVGVLRDNLLQGLANQRVAVHLINRDVPLPDSEEAHSIRRMWTDPSGRFTFREILTDGTWDLEATFAGSEMLEPQHAVAELEIARVPVSLRLTLPRAVQIGTEVPIFVQADSPGRLFSEQGLQLLVNGTSARGLWITDIGGSVEGMLSATTAGVVVVEATFPGSPVFAPAYAVQRLHVYENGYITLNADLLMDEGTQILDVAGTLSSEDGPITNAELALRLDDGWLDEGRLDDGHLDARIQTGPTGRFRFQAEVDLDAGREYTLFAAFMPEGGGEPIRNSLRFLVPEGPGESLAAWSRWAAGALALIVALVVGRLRFRARKQSRPKPRKPRPLGAAAPVGLVSHSPAPRGAPRTSASVRGAVFDADTRDAIARGTARLQSGTHAARESELEGGAFNFDTVASGHFELTVESPGYVRTSFTGSVPHRGQFLGVEVFLCSIRSWIRYLYQSFTLALYPGALPDEKLTWGWATPEQIASVLMAALVEAAPRESVGRLRPVLTELLTKDESVPADERVIRALTVLVEEVYYSGRAFQEDIVPVAEALIREATLIARGQRAD